MIRIILVNLLFLLLPLMIYFAYVYLRRGDEADEGILSNAPIFWLLAAGVGLMLAGIISLGHWEIGEPGKRYVAPEFRDGVVVPGHYE